MVVMAVVSAVAVMTSRLGETIRLVQSNKFGAHPAGTTPTDTPWSDGGRPYAGGVDDRQADFIGLSLVAEIRAWQRDELPQLRTMLGNFVGNNATYAVIELYDAYGRLLDRSTGLYLRGGSRHAEIDALDQLALNQARGGHAVIAINRPPCGRPHGDDESRRNCDDRIVDLLRFHRIEPHVYRTPHATDPTVRPGTADRVELAPQGRWTHAAAGRPAPYSAPLSLQRPIDPASLRGWLLDQEIYRLRRHAQADPARAADPRWRGSGRHSSRRPCGAAPSTS